MTIQQINWAMTHDWYYYTGTNSVTGVDTVYAHSDTGVLEFTDYKLLRKWAGY